MENPPTDFPKIVKIIDIDGLKIGFVICFELRFIKYWEKLQGCDIIFIPAMWGIKRKDSFILWTKRKLVYIWSWVGELLSKIQNFRQR